MLCHGTYFHPTKCRLVESELCRWQTGRLQCMPIINVIHTTDVLHTCQSLMFRGSLRGWEHSFLLRFLAPFLDNSMY